MENIILFDIDGTLFNAKLFMQLIRNDMAKKLNIDEERIYKAIEDYYKLLSSNTDFNPHHMLDHLSNHFKTEINLLTNIFWDNKYYRSSLYPETVEVLQNLYHQKRLGVFSQGFEDFQKHKLEASKIIKFFDKKLLFIARKKTEKSIIDMLPEKCIVIDDKLEVVEKLGQKAILIDRNNNEKTENKKIKSLLELI